MAADPNDFETPQNKVCHCFHCFPIYLLWSDGTGCHDLSFLNVEFGANFSVSSFIFIKRLFSSSLSAISGIICISVVFDISPWQTWFQLVSHPAQHFVWCPVHRSKMSRVTIHSLDTLLFLLRTSLFSMSISNCCFLTCIQISQEADQVVWYSHLISESSTVYCDPHSQRLWHSQ